MFSALIFWPRSYKVPSLQKLEKIQYLNLSTGDNIAYTQLHGKGARKPYPIIYLHGGPGGKITSGIIKSLEALTEDGYDLFLYDQIGSGQSGRLGNIMDYTVERHIKDLEEIIKQLKTEKVILIGQSWGSVLAVLFTAKNPEKIEKIIFTSPGPIYPVNKELAYISPPDSFHFRNPYYTNAQGNKAANNIRTRAMNWIAITFGKKLASDKEADEFASYLSYELNKSTVFDTTKIPKAVSGNGYYAGVLTLKSLGDVQDPRPNIRQNKVPILVLKGQADNQKWGFTKEYLDVFQNHQLVVIPNAGHGISEEQPQVYLQTIRNFLDK